MPKGTVKWFNPTKGYGVHHAGNRQQGRVRAHFGCRAGRVVDPERRDRPSSSKLVSNRGKGSAENLKMA